MKSPDQANEVQVAKIESLKNNEKQINVFDYANKRSAELASKVAVNIDSLKNLKLAPEASQKVSDISSKMDNLSQAALSQISRLQQMRENPQEQKSEVSPVKMDDGNMAPIENDVSKIDTTLNTLGPAEKNLVLKDTPEGANTMDQILDENKIDSNVSGQTKEEKMNDIIQELKKEWLGKNGTWEVSMSRSEIEQAKKDAEMRGVEWNGVTTKMTDSASEAYFNHSGNGKKSMPALAEEIYNKRFPGNSENKSELKNSPRELNENTVQKPETSNMTFNTAMQGIENGNFNNIDDDKMLEQLENANKIDYIDEYNAGDELEMTQLTDVHNAGSGVGDKVGGRLLTGIKVGEKMFVNDDNGGKSFDVNEIYNLDDKYIIETEDGFYSIAKTEQPVVNSSYREENPVQIPITNPETKSLDNVVSVTRAPDGSAIMDWKDKRIDNTIGAKMDDGNMAELDQGQETAQDAVAEFLKNEKKESSDNKLNIASNPESTKSEKMPSPDLPPIPKAEQRTVTQEKPLSWKEAQIKAEQRYLQAEKSIAEKKNSFIGKARKVGKWLSEVPGATAKLGIAGAMYGMGKLNQSQEFVSKKYNNAVESAGKSIEKARVKTEIFRQGYKNGVAEYRLEKARAKQVKINERVGINEKKALENSGNLIALNKRLQEIRAPKNNSLENKKINV